MNGFRILGWSSIKINFGLVSRLVSDDCLKNDLKWSDSELLKKSRSASGCDDNNEDDVKGGCSDDEDDEDDDEGD